MRFARIYIALVLIAGTSCNKALQLASLSFGVTADSSAHTLGVPYTFTFTGNPDLITFYSGEVGHRYAYNQRVSDTSGTAQLKFSTAVSGTNGTLSLLLSTDYSGLIGYEGQLDSGGISAATWTDITSRAVLATSTTTTSSGSVDLTDFMRQGQPVYVAFRYTAAAGSAQAKWTVSALSLTHTLPDSVYTIANLTSTSPSPGWVAGHFFGDSTINWNPTVTGATTASVIMAGGTTVATETAVTRWLVAGPISLTRVLPDVGVAVKAITLLVPTYQYTYAKSGSYTATFFAANVNADKEDSTTRTINVTIQ